MRRTTVDSVIASSLGLERQLSGACSSLGEPAFAAAWAEGRDMGQDRAIEWALDEPDR